LKIPSGTVFGSYGVACLLSVVGGGLTLFAGSFVLSDAFFSQLTATGVIMIFLGGLLYKRSKWAIFSSLAIIIVSLYDWLSLPGEAKFGLPARFEDFSPLLFVGPLFALVGGILALVWTLPLEKSNFASKTTQAA